MLRSREIVHLASASVLALALAAVVPAARAAEGGEAPEWKGYAGAGGLAFPRYAGSRSVEALPVPLLTFEYRGSSFSICPQHLPG